MLTSILYLSSGLLSLLAPFGSDVEKDVMMIVMAQLLFISAGINEIERLLREWIYEH